MSPSRLTRLVLFDIDGTILTGGPLWKECFFGAIQHHFPNLALPKIAFGGKTDIQICRETLAASGFNEDQVNENMKRIVDEYVRRAEAAVLTRSHEVELLPGVREVIEELSRDERVLLGLLTGNVKKGASAKLSTHKLNDYFRFGVYGDDHWDRYKLPPIAVERAHALTGKKFEGKQIVIIGDTIHDVNCGKAIGVRSIAVGTGRGVSMAELLSQFPDYYFSNLASTFEVIQAIHEEID